SAARGKSQVSTQDSDQEIKQAQPRHRMGLFFGTTREQASFVNIFNLFPTDNRFHVSFTLGYVP
ncbi:MAG: hypothetical protein ACJ8HF_02745, partial [Pseudomonas sp.]